MTHTPVTGEFPSCLGLRCDQFAACPTCAVRETCKKLSGSRYGRKTLAQLEVRLLPKSLDNRRVTDEDEPDDVVVRTYRELYALVFDQAPDNVSRVIRFADRVRAGAKETACDVKTFIEVVMRAHEASQPERRFYANQLVGPFAIKRVEDYRSICARRYGTFDARSVASILSSDLSHDRAAARIEDSELTAARWVIGYKVRHGGEYLKHLYKSSELRLDPAWLAIEPSYSELLFQDGDTEEITKHRKRARLVLLDLKKRNPLARAVFAAREHAVKRALSRVLEDYRISHEDLEREAKPVTDPLHFYAKVAMAIQHVLCLRYVAGDNRVLSSLHV